MQLGPHFLSHHPKELGENENVAYVFFPLYLGKMGIEPMLFPKELHYTFCGEKFVRGKCLYLCKLDPLPWPSCPKKKYKLWQVQAFFALEN
jgi:hypothetical protein